MRGLAALGALLALLVSFEAQAHRSQVQRTLSLEPSEGGLLQLLASVRVPGGMRRQVLIALVDRDHDGQLAEQERRELEQHLVARAFEGLQLFAGSSTAAVAVQGLAAKLRVPDDPKAPIELLAHGTVALPAQVRVLRLTTARGGDPLSLIVLPGTRAVAETSRGKIRIGGFSASLGPKDEVRWKISSAAE